MATIRGSQAEDRALPPKPGDGRAGARIDRGWLRIDGGWADPSELQSQPQGAVASPALAGRIRVAEGPEGRGFGGRCRIVRNPMSCVADKSSVQRSKTTQVSFSPRLSTVASPREVPIVPHWLLISLMGLCFLDVMACSPSRGSRDAGSARVQVEDGSVHRSLSPARDAGSSSTTVLSSPHSDVGPRSGISSPCVLHAGDVHTHRREALNSQGEVVSTSSKAECSFNAECVRRQGISSPGDGNVSLECVGKRCICSLKPLSRSARPTIFSFESDTPCSTGDMAERLILERCMAGLTVLRH
jgi:hypothetical protein